MNELYNLYIKSKECVTFLWMSIKYPTSANTLRGCQSASVNDL